MLSVPSIPILAFVDQFVEAKLRDSYTYQVVRELLTQAVLEVEFLGLLIESGVTNLGEE